jgi:hypothetical protein
MTHSAKYVQKKSVPPSAAYVLRRPHRRNIVPAWKPEVHVLTGWRGQNINVTWLCPIILFVGALLAWGPAMTKHSAVRLRTRGFPSWISFLRVMALLNIGEPAYSNSICV